MPDRHAQRTHLYQRFYQEVVDRIVSGDLREGDILPSIVDISGDYHIAVNTIRTAFEMLQRDGYIRSIKKKGTVVVRDQFSEEEIVTYLMQRRTAYHDVCDLMAELLPRMAVFGASLCTEREMEQLWDVVERFQGEGIPVREFYKQWDNFLQILLIPLQNERFSTLVRKANRFVRFPLVVSHLHSDFLNLSKRKSPAAMREMIQMIEERSFERLGNKLRDSYQLTARQIENYLSGFPDRAETGCEVSFFGVFEKFSNLLYSQIATDLAYRIGIGLYPCGSYLPSQTELVERYGASITSVRNALAVLSRFGMVQYDSGRGYCVHGEESAETQELPVEVSSPVFLRSLQVLITTCQAVCRHAVMLVPVESIDFFEALDAKLYGKPEGILYSSSRLLMGLWIRELPNPVMRELFLTLEVELTFTRHWVRRDADFDRAREEIHGLAHAAARCLRARDAEGFGETLYRMLSRTAGYIKLLQERMGVECSIPLPRT